MKKKYLTPIFDEYEFKNDIMTDSNSENSEEFSIDDWFVL